MHMPMESQNYYSVYIIAHKPVAFHYSALRYSSVDISSDAADFVLLQEQS